jgi:pimeloyl-ACP methyl ester carboxylesterase
MRQSFPQGGCSNYNSMAMFGTTEQNIFDKINMNWGLIFGIDVVYPQLVGINFKKDIPRVEVPVYFLTGRKDDTTVQDIAYRYYEKLEAPIKKFFWFEIEGHNNCFENNRKYINILTKEILPEIQHSRV